MFCFSDSHFLKLLDWMLVRQAWLLWDSVKLLLLHPIVKRGLFRPTFPGSFTRMTQLHFQISIFPVFLASSPSPNPPPRMCVWILLVHRRCSIQKLIMQRKMFEISLAFVQCRGLDEYWPLRLVFSYARNSRSKWVCLRPQIWKKMLFMSASSEQEVISFLAPKLQQSLAMNHFSITLIIITAFFLLNS